MLKKRFYFFFLLVFFFSSLLRSHAQLNLVQRSFISFPGQQVAGVWHYVDSLNREYALVGTEHGISIVDVTDPSTPVFILQVPGVTSLWHEIKTWSHYAYATSEGIDSLHVQDGLQVIDLRYLPDSAPAHFWQGDGIIAGQLHKGHTVTVDNGYVYVNGHDILALHSGVLIADLNDPWNPHFVGADTLNYCHDSFVRGDSLWASEIMAGQFAVYDISDRSSPVLVATQRTPSAFNHNTWLSDDSRVLFTTDERNHAPLGSYDVSDLNNIELLDTYNVQNIVNAGNSDEVHNVRVINNYLVNACYGSQITLVDATRPDNLVEVGNFPIQASLAWDADPFLPSGNILATGISTGLYVLSPTYTRACYLEGMIRDSLTSFPLNNVLVQFLTTIVKDSSKYTGVYKTGCVDAGIYNIQFSKNGYFPKMISGVTLSTGSVTTLDVRLARDFSAVGELKDEKRVSVFPNPFSESAQLIIDDRIFSSSRSLNLIIKDATGKIAKKFSGILSSPFIVTRENLNQGIYFYELRNESEEILGKGKFSIQ